MLSKRLSQHINDMDNLNEIVETAKKIHPLLAAVELQAKGDCEAEERVAHLCDEIDWAISYLTSKLSQPAKRQQ